MAWLSQNWFWVVVFVVFIGMHLFGHGGHGGGCGGGHEPRRPSDKDKATPPAGHRH